MMLEGGGGAMSYGAEERRAAAGAVSHSGTDPTRVETQAQFGAALTELRERAGLTVREAARKAGLAAATAGGYFAGTHLPALKLVESDFAALLSVLGVTDEGETRAWFDAVHRVRRGTRRRSTDQRSPYRGLAPFELEDAACFFGRAELTALLHERALSQREAGAPLFVLGPSGSGKSSVLRAGLISLLHTQGGTAALITPGRGPLAALERAMWDAEPPEWIVVDQFEELFTQHLAAQERTVFIDALLAAATRFGVVIGMRADFYAAALAEPELAPHLQDGQVVVGAMDRDQLREAIVGPAEVTGVSVERGLVDLLVEETVELGRERAATLPLLSHALLAAWAAHEGHTITSADYLATGGIANAVARSAEEAFGELDSTQQETARQVIVHLVQIAEGSADTARKVSLDQLPGLTVTDSGNLPEAISVFIDRRLLTVGVDTLQIAHEALLSSWPRLRAWLDADRAALLARRRVAFAAEGWHQAAQDPAALLRGAQLAAAEALVTESSTWRPTALEREFLAASAAQRDAERSARLRTAKRLRLLAGALAVLLLVATATAGYGFDQRANAQSATRLADSRAVAEAGDSIRGLDPSAAAQLSLASYRIAPTVQSLSALLNSTDAPSASRVVDGSKVVQAVAVAPRRRLAAAADADGTLRLWNIANPGDPTAIGRPLLAPSSRQLFAAAISPDENLVVTAGSADVVDVWSIADPARPLPLPPLTGPTNTVYALAFNPAGTLLAAASADGAVWLGRITHGALVRAARLQAPVVSPGPCYIQSVAFSPDGRQLAAGTSDGRVLIWNPANPAKPPAVVTGLGSAVLALAFSPNGRLLATGTRGMQLRFWSVTAAQSEPGSAIQSDAGSGAVTPDGGALSAGTSWVNSLAFSPDGRQVAIGTGAKNVQLWNVATRTLETVLPHPEPVAAVAWAGARTLISGCADGVVRFWSLPTPALPASGVVNALAFSPDNRILAVASDTLRLWDPRTRTPLGPALGPAGEAADGVAFSLTTPLLAAAFGDRTLRVWDIADPAHPRPIGAPVQAVTGTGVVESLTFDGSGTMIATGGDDDTVRLWAVHADSAPSPGAVLSGFTGQVFSVAFLPHSDVLAAGSVDGSVRLWRVAGPHDARQLGRPLSGFPAYVYSVAFSPKGNTLAVGIANGTVQLWNVSNPSNPVPDGPPLTGPLGYSYTLAFSSDGTTLADADTDDSLWLWNVADPAAPAVQATLTGATDSLYAVAFSPTGGLLAAGGADGSVHLWLPQPAAATAALCADLGEPLSPAAWARDAPGLPMTTPCT